MKIKIIYTGNPEETQVIDTETGKVIQNIIEFDVALDHLTVMQRLPSRILKSYWTIWKS